MPSGSPEHSYGAAGVSLATAESVVERLRAAVESTGAHGFGAFAALHPLDDERLLAASTDGVGTKLILARERGRLRDCGADLAAHCINDVVTCGADPLILLDYVAANQIRLDEVAELVEGAASVCRAAGVALVGGETAELPGIYAEGELDFAGTCVGTVARDAVVDGSMIRPGDVIVGFASAGVHANGFTLVRRVLQEEDYDGPDLLAPTRLYLDTARALRGRAKAFVHVTGGGLQGNTNRVLPPGRTATFDWESWDRPPVFEWLRRHIDEEELRRVFNLGIGWCAVVSQAEAGELVIGRIS
jgi:phosphoribosylformylglycinamidine cyclo-ligase